MLLVGLKAKWAAFALCSGAVSVDNRNRRRMCSDDFPA